MYFLEIFVCASFVYVLLYLFETFVHFGCCSVQSPVTDKQNFFLSLYRSQKVGKKTINLNWKRKKKKKNNTHAHTNTHLTNCVWVTKYRGNALMLVSHVRGIYLMDNCVLLLLLLFVCWMCIDIKGVPVCRKLHLSQAKPNQKEKRTQPINTYIHLTYASDLRPQESQAQSKNNEHFTSQDKNGQQKIQKISKERKESETGENNNSPPKKNTKRKSIKRDRKETRERSLRKRRRKRNIAFLVLSKAIVLPSFSMWMNVSYLPGNYLLLSLSTSSFFLCTNRIRISFWKQNNNKKSMINHKSRNEFQHCTLEHTKKWTFWLKWNYYKYQNFSFPSKLYK